MSRPSIALCMIAKNEAHNLSTLLQSVKGCFDEIHITDTGSTDSTVQFLEKINEQIKAGSRVWEGIPEIQIHHFKWINDFAAARNYSFSHAKSDYIMWLDCDDALSDAKAFISWRDSVLHSAHYWVALYNYAFNDNGVPVCKFIRERVIKRDYGFKWEYFVHEGILQVENRKYWPQRASSWWVNHKRSEEDKKQDYMRNINLFESHDYDSLPPRMKFYYGKELTENKMPEKGCKPLLDAVQSGKLDMHDNILAIQYAAHSARDCKAYAQAVDILMNGLKLMINRAEYWCLLGDVYVATNSLVEAKLAYESALKCQPNDMGGIVVLEGAAYAELPHLQLANILMTQGNLEGAEEHIKWLANIGHPAAIEMANRVEALRNLGTIRDGLPKTDDVIITCPPMSAVTGWDENTLASKGHGGSETAAIEVAKWIKHKTNRRVKIFHPRVKREVMPSGVEYVPISELVGYLHNVEPHAHISWRHAVPLTKAKTYVWCHDLQCPGAEKADNYDKIVALSGFHKHYLTETNGVPEDKIVLGFNGINPNDFNEVAEKDPLKVVFSSSPDRGLIQTIDIVKKAREVSGLDIKIHCFYGFENMRKAGQHEWADQIEAKIRENSFVVAHGLVTKKELMRHFKEAGVWLYPADFIETFCITAIEALCAGTWGIVRSMGALPYTLSEAIEKGMVQMTDVEATGEANIGLWANLLVEAIIEKKWERVTVLAESYSWERVADFFAKEMSL